MLARWALSAWMVATLLGCSGQCVDDYDCVGQGSGLTCNASRQCVPRPADAGSDAGLP